MRVATVKEFRDKATRMFRSSEPIIVMRHGEIAGIFFPQPGQTLPLELKHELFDVLSKDIARRLRSAGVTEQEVLTDFEEWRGKRRASRRRR